jgi:predicted alpha/beta hydrolase family esterase
MTKVLIVPGLNGSPEGHWQDWWLVDNRDAMLVQQDDWSDPTLEDWLYRLEFELHAHDRVVLVAHSLGAVLVANLSGRLAASKVAGALLVAPCDLDRTNRLHPGRIRFSSMPKRPLPFPSVLVASRNDPYVSFEAARKYAGAWGSALIDLGDAGHINIAAGYGRWPEAYGLVSAFGIRPAVAA